MKLTRKHEGRRVRRPWWTRWEWYRLKMLGDHIVVAADQDGKEVIFNRDDMDTDWVLMAEDIQEFPLQEGRSL